MSANKAMIIVVALVAALVVTFMLVFRHNATIHATLPFDSEIHLEGKTEPPQKPGQIRGEDLQAGHDLTAGNQMGGDVEIKRATAEEDIRLTTQAPASDNGPKE